MFRPGIGWWISLSLGVALLDQAAKRVMTGLLEPCPPSCESIVLLPFFQLLLLHNEGAAFSFLSEAGGWQRWLLSGVSATVSLFLVVWMYRLHPSRRLLGFGLALILGGALGNLADRLLLGHVVDFLVVHYDRWFFPAFNLADAAISMGVLLMVLDMLFGPDDAAEARN